MKHYLWHLENMVSYIDLFEKEVIKECFTDNKGKVLSKPPDNYWYCWTPIYQGSWVTIRDIIEICDMLGIQYLAEQKPELIDRVTCLNNPESIEYKSYFEDCLRYIRSVFKIVQKRVKAKLQLLNMEEKKRLNEALNCYIEGCNYSAVTMSVSAIEHRLLSLMMSKCLNPELEELTLGQLIKEYMDNKEKYANVIPKKHEPLLQLCNVYRIFSVHAKREKITRPIATSIINMTFSFLLDEDLKHKAEENKK